MAKVKAPLFGFSASGALGDAIVFGDWKGVQYARQHVVPANPNTAAQAETRGVFSMLNAMWKAMQTLALAPWNSNAQGQAYHGRNKFISVNLPVLRDEVNMANFLGSPGSLAGIPPASVAAVFDGPSDEIRVTITAPTLPAGWTIQGGVAIAFPEQDPSAVFLGPVKEAEDLVTPYVAIITAVTLPLGTWRVSGWFRYLRPDGQTAYGTSLQTSVVVA